MTNKQKGVLLAVVGASLWGTSGTAAEFWNSCDGNRWQFYSFGHYA